MRQKIQSQEKHLVILNVGTGKDITINSRFGSLKIAQKIGYEGIIEWEELKEDNGTPRKLLDVSSESPN